MKKINIILMAVISLVFLLILSCKKDSPSKKGCTDTDAINLCSDCDVEDHSCEYQGQVIFWYDQNTSNFLIDDDAFSLTYYVDGQIAGSSSTIVYWNGTLSPGCGTQGLVTVTKNLGNVKSLSYNYQIKDQTGWVYWEGVINFVANQCNSLHLVSTNKNSKK